MSTTATSNQTNIGFRETFNNSKTIFLRNYLIFKRGVFYFLASVIFETLIYFYAFAMLLAQIVNTDSFSYTQFFIPSIIALVGVQTAFVESAWNSLKRFSSRKSLVTYLSTQLRIEDIYMGELVWSLSKSALASVISLMLLIAINVYSLGNFVLLILTILLNCWCFSALSLFLLSFSQSEMTFTKHHIFVMLPIVVFSNIFFPYKLMPSFMQALASMSPLTHVTECLRMIQTDNITQQFYLHLGVLFFMCLFFTYISYSFIKRRMQQDVYMAPSLSSE